jgi:AcrR family transcriptional regulator
MSDTESTTTRRMGPVGSATWHLMLDGAEAILREEGYAELTSRRIANRVGIKQQLVYYYFRTMDELMVEAFRRLAKRELERLEAALSSDRPLHEIWSVCIQTSDARLISEFMALANRSEGVRTEVIAYIERSRRLEIAAINKAIARRAGEQTGLPPVAIAFLATSAALAMNREAALGVSMGHAEIEQLIARSLAALEPE